MNAIKLILSVACLASIFVISEATYGVDVSSAISTSTFQCLKGDGYDFAIVRCWESTGKTDPNCPSTVSHAWSAGLAHVDVYMFPCYSCGNPSGQVKSAYDYLNSNGVKYGEFWFDIEGPQYWSSTQGNNVNFMESMLSEAKTLGIKVGIYTSQSQWQPIMGSWTGGSSYPLWYAHYDDEANFNDFVPFNGWTKPAMKQYYGDATVCSADIDKDWYPSS